jgi:4-hydroxy-4-methyl-2-oxoglutarate aldolase
LSFDASQLLELRDRLLRVSTCDIADALDTLGLRDQTALGLTKQWDCPRIAGRALTVKLGPDFEGSTVIGTLEAIESAAVGDVLVLDNGGLLDRNAFGSVAAFAAARYGISGVIIDGVTRDLDDLRQQGFAVYARGVTTTSVRGRTGFDSFGGEIQCGGIVVRGEDFVVADASGVIVIPGELVAQVAEVAPRFPVMERELRRRITAGELPSKIHIDMRYEDLAAVGGESTNAVSS